MTMHYRPPLAVSDLSDVAAGHLTFRRQSGYYRDHLKRAGDIVLVLLMAPIALPLILLVAMVVALDGHSPFYRQDRIGRGGRVFAMLKMRSMVPDADRKLAGCLRADPRARREWDRHQKLRNDPRITRVGRFIRKTSLDELPQLWNVLTGDMSLVGPRPMMTAQRAIYPGNAYFEMRPGVTGLWQVSDRNETSFAERALFDTRYYNKVSWSTDLGILLRTVGVVLHATGH